MSFIVFTCYFRILKIKRMTRSTEASTIIILTLRRETQLKEMHLAVMSGNLNLKTLDTNGNCQRPVFSLCASQRMHKITNL